jgi:hypothetical protein
MGEIPLTAWELREIAKILDETKRKFGEDETMGGNGLTKFGERFYNIHLEVLRPETDEVIGVIEYYDGWLGFKFKEAK